MGVLIFINPQIMLISILFFGLLYSVVVFMSNKSISDGSRVINQTQNNIIKSLQNGLGAIRDIILDKTQKFYLTIFERSSFSQARKAAFLDFVRNSPRYILEGMGIVLFVLLLIYWSETKSKENFMIIFPTLAALIIGAQRILPLMNQIYTNLVIVREQEYQVKEVLVILEKYLISEKQKRKILKKNVQFKNSITFKNVSFSYDNQKNIFEDVNLEIPRGLKVRLLEGQEKEEYIFRFIDGFIRTSKGIYIN